MMNDRKRGRREAEFKDRKKWEKFHVIRKKHCALPFPTHNKYKVKRVQGFSKQRSGSASTRHEEVPPEKKRAGVRIEEKCKAAGVEARHPSCRRQVFRTSTRHLELCLPVGQSGGEEKEGNINSEKEKKRDET